MPDEGELGMKPPIVAIYVSHHSPEVDLLMIHVTRRVIESNNGEIQKLIVQTKWLVSQKSKVLYTKFQPFPPKASKSET
jgi:hypothetical protein